MPQGPATDRDRARLTRFTFLLHLRPVRVPARTLRWTHTYGFGGTCLVLLVLLALTGTLQMLVYQPLPELAYASVRDLTQQTAFGPLVRGIHYWSANLLVLVALLHTGRVVLTGGHQGVRRFTWVLGAGLLAAILAAGFTGYLLPWDQLSYWAVTVATGMLSYVPGIGEPLRQVVLGGERIGPATLVNFYTVHTTIVPVALVLAAAWHFWRVRRAGGVIVPPADPDLTDPGQTDPDEDPASVMFWPDLLVRELAQALVVVAVVVALGALVGAPLGEQANPGMSPNPAKAPWYFVGGQELLIHLHPVFAVLVLPLAGLMGFLLLPYLTPADHPGGAWFLSAAGRRSALMAALAAAVITPALVMLDARTARSAANWLTGGLLPLAGIVAAAGACYLLARRRGANSAAESVQAVVVLLAVSYIVLTVIGAWFRGPGMVLTWPWAGGMS